jgi:hypothetical protein
MRNITGQVDLTITAKDGVETEITIPGNEFGLEDGGELTRDRDDGELCGGFLFIAFCDGFELHLSFNIHGAAVTRYSLTVGNNELDSASIAIISDELDVSGVFSAHEED